MWEWYIKRKDKYSFHLTVEEANFLDKLTDKLKIDWFYIDASCYIHDAEELTGDNPYELLCALDDAIDFAEDEEGLLTFSERRQYEKILTRAMACADADGLLPAGMEVVSHVGMAHRR